MYEPEKEWYIVNGIYWASDVIHIFHLMSAFLENEKNEFLWEKNNFSHQYNDMFSKPL